MNPDRSTSAVRAIESSAFSPQPNATTSLNSLHSARVVVPLVLELVHARSVVDFGCKHGEWLSVFREQGATRLLGFDQAKRLGQGLLIPASEFQAVDLAAPVSLPERFDLSVCIEVAEHLPESAAATLVQSITAAAPVVLFSAAMPGQGGHGHLNEQPRQYWCDLFARHGFTSIDCLRPRIWQNEDVAWWYRQNLFLFCTSDAVQQSARLRAERSRKTATDLDLVHVDRLNRRIGELARDLVHAITKRVTHPK